MPLLAHLGLAEQVELLTMTDLSRLVAMAAPTPLLRFSLRAAAYCIMGSLETLADVYYDSLCDPV